MISPGLHQLSKNAVGNYLLIYVSRTLKSIPPTMQEAAKKCYKGRD